jgi:ribonuclease HII
MTEALRRAARRALGSVTSQGCDPDRILLDGAHDYIGDRGRVRTIVDGDASSLAIAAASIIAKVTRDRMMAEESVHYPAYEFDSNRGYPAPNHKFALQAYGPTAIHRRSWIFMEGLPWFAQPAEPAQTSLFA